MSRGIGPGNAVRGRPAGDPSGCLRAGTGARTLPHGPRAPVPAVTLLGSERNVRDTDVSTARARCVRTCIGCRERTAPADLLRVVLRGRDVVPDPAGSLAGRGAWVHPACIEVAERRRAFSRALRAVAPPSTSAVREYAASMVAEGPDHPSRSVTAFESVAFRGPGRQTGDPEGQSRMSHR
ncbi:MAG: YlxR family protein [bacterium]